MSLLSHSTDTLRVYVEVDGTDSDGNVTREPDAEPTTVVGRVQPVRADEEVAAGQVTRTIYRFIGRVWPSGPFARIEWDGRDWDIVGEPLWSRGSEATRHVVVLLTAREPLEV